MALVKRERILELIARHKVVFLTIRNLELMSAQALIAEPQGLANQRQDIVQVP